MAAKDYLTLAVSVLALLVSVLGFLRFRRNDRKEDLAKAEVEAAAVSTRILEAISIKNEIIIDYMSVQHLITKYNFGADRLFRLADETIRKDDLIGQPLLENMRRGLQNVDAEGKNVERSIDIIRALDPKAIVTEPNARDTVEALRGAPRELKVRLESMIEETKLGEEKLLSLMNNKRHQD